MLTQAAMVRQRRLREAGPAAAWAMSASAVPMERSTKLMQPAAWERTDAIAAARGSGGAEKGKIAGRGIKAEVARWDRMVAGGREPNVRVGRWPDIRRSGASITGARVTRREVVPSAASPPPAACCVNHWDCLA